MRLFLAALISGASLLGISSAHALTTFFNDFGPGNTYQTLGAFVVDGSNVFLGEDTAMPFISLATGAVTEIDVALTNNGGTNRATVGLYTDNAGSLGSLIQSWPVSHQPEFGRTDDKVTKITGITGVSLTAGTAYFLYITPGAADTDDDWNQNSIGVTATVITFCSQAPPFCPMTHSGTLSAFDVIGGATHHHDQAAAADPPATPLPAALPLFATGLGALGLLGWWRKKKATARGEPVMRPKIVAPVVGFALAVLTLGTASAATIAGPTLTDNTASHPVSGLSFHALDNSTLTGFIFQNQGAADTVVLTDAAGNILHSISTPVATPSYNASVNWSLTSGNTYWLLETSGTNSKFVAFGLPLPSNADIAITFSGTFDSTIAGAIANNGGFQSNEWWAAFNDITTSSSAVPLPAALPLFATGLAGLGLLFWRRKRKAQAVD